MSMVKRKSLKSWMKSIMFRNIHGMLSCGEFEDFIQVYIDGELDAATRATFERHIRLCRECREYLAAYQRAVEVGSSVLQDRKESVPADVPEDLIRAILYARGDS